MRERERESEKLRREEGNDVNEKEELVFHSFATSWVNYRVSFLIWRDIKAPQSGEIEERKQERRKYKEIRRCKAYKENRLVYIYSCSRFPQFFFSLLFFYYRAILSSGIVLRGSRSLNEQRAVRV